MRLAALFLLLTGLCAAQNVRYDGQAIGPRGPIPFVSVAVCSQPATTTTQPCTPLASLCTSLADSTCTSPNPVLGDLLGNYFFYIKQGSTPVTVQIYGTQVATPYVATDQISVYPSSSAAFNGVLYIGGGLTAWGGGDIGTQANAAYAALPSTGGRIRILSQSPCYSFTTPMAFSILNKPVLLEGDPGGATCIKYTPTTGSAITIDSGVSERQAYGVRDLQLIGPGNSTTAIGINLGPSNGAEGAVLSGIKFGTNCCSTDGFGTDINQAGGSAFLITVEKSFIEAGGVGMAFVGGENFRLINNTFTHNTGGAITVGAAGTTDIYAYGNSFDDNAPPSISLPSSGGSGIHFVSNSNHYENASVATAANGYVSVGGNNSFSSIGDQFLDDRVSGTNSTGFITCSGTSYVTVLGSLRNGNGITVNPTFNPSGTCRAFLSWGYSNSFTLTDYPIAYTGATIIDQSLNGAGASSLALANGNNGANVNLPFGGNLTTGLTANLGSTQLGPTTVYAGNYLVCVSLWPTATGTATAIQATVSGNANGTPFTANVGSVLSLAALANVGGGCTSIPAAVTTTINVATTGYSGTGTYSVRSSVVEIQ